MKAYRAALVLTLVAGAPAAAQTNGFVLQCLSARTAGQGCVTRAQGSIPTTLFRDPAGITGFDRPALEVNAAPFMPALTFSNGANTATVDGSRHVYPLVSAAYIAPRQGRFAWAVGVEPIGGFGADFRLRHELLSGPDGTLLDYESFFAAAKFGPVVAWELSHGFSVGASLSGTYAQIRDFRMPFSMAPAVAQGLAGIPQLDPAVYGPLFQQLTEMTAYGDSKSYDGLTWTADLGIAWRSPTGLAFSASWSPRRKIRLDGGTATIDMTAQFGQMLEAMVQSRALAYGESTGQAQAAVMQQLGAAGLDLQAGVLGHYAAATELAFPMTIGAGVAVPVSEKLRLAGELEWREWSEAEDIMPFRLTKGDNANLNLMMNADPRNGDFTYPFPLLWQDALTVKVGGTYSLNETTALRAGYMQGGNPVPDNTVFVAFPAISTRALSLGFSVNAAGLPLDVSYVRAFEHRLDGCTNGHRIGSEYVNSSTTMSQDVLTFGMLWRFQD
jgi:long-subunit fatty acid transport protein